MIKILVGLFIFIFTVVFSPVAKNPKTPTIKKEMQITSSVFTNNSNIPQKFTCQAEGVNPPLKFSDIPANTKSLTLIVDDPDAIHGLFTHWVIFNMPPDTTEIKENSVPVGAVESTTSGGKPGFFAPCPPSGTGNHRYQFKLYALDIVLVLTPNVSVDDIENAMQGHIIASSQLTGIYPPK